MKMKHFSLSRGIESPVCVTETTSGEGPSCYVFSDRSQNMGGGSTCGTCAGEYEEVPVF